MKIISRKHLVKISSFIIAGTIIISIFLAGIVAVFPHNLESVDYWHWIYWSRIAKQVGCDLDILSPHAGQGGLSVPICYNLNPSFLVSGLFPKGLEESSVQVISSVFYLAAVWILGRTISLRPRESFVTSILSLIFLNPFYLPAASNGYIKLSSSSFHIFDHLAAIYSIIPVVILLIAAGIKLIKAHSRRPMWAALIFLMIWWLFILNPNYALVFLPLPIFFISCLALFQSHNRKRNLMAALGIVASLLVTGLPLFVYHYTLTARSLFGNEIYSEVQTFDYLNSLPLRIKDPLSVIFFSGELCCLFWLFRKRKVHKSFSQSLLFLNLFITIIGLIYTFSGIRWKYPSPVYMEQPILPLLLIPVAIFISRSYFFRELFVKIRSSKWLLVILPLSFSLTVGYVFRKSIFAINTGLDRLSMKHKQLQPQRLKKDIEISSHDTSFKGSIAEVIGTPGSPIANLLGYRNPSEPHNKFLLMNSSKLTRMYFIPGYSLGNLWLSRIPSTTDNNHMVSPFKYYFFSRLLSRRNDHQSRNWLSITNLNLPALKLLGSSYVLTDQTLNLPISETFAGPQTFDMSIKLYKVFGANLGNFYPTNIVYANSAKQMVNLMEHEKDFSKTAYLLERELVSRELVKGTTFEFDHSSLGTFTVKASSRGTSLLVLPIEYRNTLIAKGKGNFKLIRANLMLTGVLFTGDIDVKLSSEGGPFNYIATLKQARDIANYSFEQRPEIYPSGYQPHAWLR